MLVERLEHNIFTSNTYVLTTAKSNQVWLVDLGSFDQVFNSLPNGQLVVGVLLTHYHYDHIYFINKLIEVFPSCKIFASSHTIEGLYDPKMNLSFYHEDPITYRGEMPEVLNDGDEIMLFDGITAKVFATPGHNPGCMTFEVEGYLFTGDSYIPHLDVVTKLKYGNKSDSRKSLHKIRHLLNSNSLICPGHGSIVQAIEALPHLKSLANP
jgi:glyoxylase-like metal-dependent hydrolase (beta-lactamase superfamily II)